jgi:hypothetical protein
MPPAAADSAAFREGTTRILINAAHRQIQYRPHASVSDKIALSPMLMR